MNSWNIKSDKSICAN